MRAATNRIYSFILNYENGEKTLEGVSGVFEKRVSSLEGFHYKRMEMM